ncbi:IS110 family transposase [Phyllobacterium zundukense]|uniref:IS110 family transposase n=1 Tax=Phyllobacterium zundukense TaxID=1867719 RepID=A0A2N9VZ16_9HYPH|nr:IS110 family transposase [Phyllobacterium zundukense]ATU95448.1 IS110 family transposase [Phyllobacterium zundukense]PIO44734.1 IS110 family transposase [Phyllobacterium zundukense]
MAIAFIGIDLAKNVFQLHGTDAAGRQLFSKRLRRDQLLPELVKLPPCIIGIEACTGAFFWQRQFEKLGYSVKIIAPQYVKPFVKHQKNDQNDAEAICTAMRQPNMKFVPTKNQEEQDIQSLHRARSRLVNHRTALVSQMRGLLLDRGITVGITIRRARRAIPEIIADMTNDLTDMTRDVIAELLEFLDQIDQRVKAFDRRIEAVFRANPTCQRIARICGVGPKTATAIVAAVGDGSEFKNGRHLAAWMGLVPRQHSSGNRKILMGISKRGDQRLRTLLVHGARAVVRVTAKREDAFSRWVNALRERRGMNRAIVAVANKNARIIWAVLRRDVEFQSAT